MLFARANNRWSSREVCEGNQCGHVKVIRAWFVSSKPIQNILLQISLLVGRQPWSIRNVRKAGELLQRWLINGLRFEVLAPDPIERRICNLLLFPRCQSRWHRSRNCSKRKSSGIVETAWAWITRSQPVQNLLRHPFFLRFRQRCRQGRSAGLCEIIQCRIANVSKRRTRISHPLNC